MSRKKILCYSLLLLGFVGNTQEKKIEKADTKYTNYAYASAIRSYEQLVKDGFTEEQIFKNLGNANYLNANYEAAANWYSQLFQLGIADIDPEYMYRYAQSLKSLENYEWSDKWMQKFKEAKLNDQRAIKFNENLDYLEQIESRSGRYQLKNAPFNSNTSDFAPSFYGKELVFSTARDSGLTSKNIHRWNNEAFLNLYKASGNSEKGFSQVSKLAKKLNKKTHESSTAFTKDGQTMYFTRNNSTNGKFDRDDDGVSRLKIYRATKRNGDWQNIEELPFNSDDYSVAHPTLNQDESKLYFASDMPGTKGESDIFVVAIHTDGSFGTPQNLGNKINTEARETFPFITASDILYFSSDGHPGLGGLDVFATDIKKDDSSIINVGRPLNGEEDDFSFIIDETSGKGFFASNREGGLGNDDIYSFVETEPLNFSCQNSLTVIVKDAETEQPLANASINIYDQTKHLISSTMTNSQGAFSLEVDCGNSELRIVAEKEEYEQGQEIFNVNETKNNTIELRLPKSIISAPLGTDLAKYLDIEPIYFDFDKYNIRQDAKMSINKVLIYLKEFPMVRIQVRSHTDSRANDQYNMQLSAQRAKSTAAT